MISRQFLGFVLCSTIAAGVNFGSRLGFSWVMDFMWAVFLAFWCGLITAFLLNKFFVFKNSALTTKRQFSGFLLINLIALIQTLGVSYLLAEWGLKHLNYGYEIAHLCGIASPIFTSYFGHKWISFREPSTAYENIES